MAVSHSTGARRRPLSNVPTAIAMQALLVSRTAVLIVPNTTLVIRAAAMNSAPNQMR